MVITHHNNGTLFVMTLQAKCEKNAPDCDGFDLHTESLNSNGNDPFVDKTSRTPPGCDALPMHSKCAGIERLQESYGQYGAKTTTCVEESCSELCENSAITHLSTSSHHGCNTMVTWSTTESRRMSDSAASSDSICLLYTSDAADE